MMIDNGMTSNTKWKSLVYHPKANQAKTLPDLRSSPIQSPASPVQRSPRTFEEEHKTTAS